MNEEEKERNKNIMRVILREESEDE